jgi:cell division protein FtsA
MNKTIIKSKRNIVAALDVGSAKICCAIAEYDGTQESLRLVGIGQHVSQGIKNGVITDMEAMEHAILNAVHGAEKMADVTVKNVFVNISGTHLLSETVDVSVNVQGQDIDDKTVGRILFQGTQANKTRDFEIIHAIPLTYTLDGTKGIKDPRGMHGNMLCGTLNVITASSGPVRNLVSCVHRCHLGINALIASPLAAGFGVLVEDEMDLGVTLIDIGGGTTDIAVFLGSNLMHIDCLPVGGSHITSDLAQGLSTSLAQAERIKVLYGSAFSRSEDQKEMIMIPQMVEDRYNLSTQMNKANVTNIIQPRMEEILELVAQKLTEAQMNKLPGRRVVLTGGTSQMPGMREFASKILNKQVRIGRPLRIQNLEESYAGPAFANCGGLLVFAAREILQSSNNSAPERGVLQKFQNWFKNNF